MARRNAAPWFKELLYVAMNASATHLFEPGLKIQIANARRHGASLAQLVDVIQVTTLLGQASLSLVATALAGTFSDTEIQP